MRLRKTFFLVLFLAGVLARPGIRGWHSLGQLLRPGQWSERLREETYSDAAMVIDNNDFVAIDLPSTWRRLRVLTNATLRRGQATQSADDSESPEHFYNLEYQFLDKTGEILSHGDYHFRTRTIRYRDAESGELFYPTFFANPDYLPAETQSMICSREGMPENGTQLRLRLKRTDADIVDVAVRVFSQSALPEQRTTLKWQRMAREERFRVARANIYTPKLLSKTEIHDLIQGKWSALSPGGIRGVDYRCRTLYTLKNFEGEEIRPPEIAAGVPLSNQIRAMLPLPDEAGQLQLQLQPADNRARVLPIPLLIHWYPPGLQRPQTYHFIATSSSNSFELVAEGGLIEVESQHDMVLRRFGRQQQRPLPQKSRPGKSRSGKPRPGKNYRKKSRRSPFICGPIKWTPNRRSTFLFRMSMASQRRFELI